MTLNTVLEQIHVLSHASSVNIFVCTMYATIILNKVLFFRFLYWINFRQLVVIRIFYSFKMFRRNIFLLICWSFWNFRSLYSLPPFLFRMYIFIVRNHKALRFFFIINLILWSSCPLSFNFFFILFIFWLLSFFIIRQFFSYYLFNFWRMFSFYLFIYLFITFLLSFVTLFWSFFSLLFFSFFLFFTYLITLFLWFGLGLGFGFRFRFRVFLVRILCFCFSVLAFSNNLLLFLFLFSSSLLLF